ncbi:DMT family transporter [Agrococcus carbonis]|uniref:Threonine/homoserine efflux transporter RhtA n=1 Tax=Agrococcus carbonis TaxID=684552 RepID=A0A1H1KTT8_9MICO|nr:DMT family transporter [Agrococcus carbonis]SDR65557.1 Threonine/homoserine efflux transporter RhtA [Agrococcus carbonis]
MVERSTARLATLLLVGLTIVWGSTFFLIKDLVAHVPSLDFLGVRFLLAAGIMTAIAWRRVARLGRALLLRSAVLGLLYTAAQILQTVGLETTPASVSGFLTGLYVVLTPLIAATAFRHRIDRGTWIAVGVASAGLVVLTLTGIDLGPGAALTLGGALAYALHIIATARWARVEHALGISIVQLWVIGIVCLAAGAPDGVTLPATAGQWASMLYMVVFASIAAMWVQTWAQAQLSATRAAVIMTAEPVWATAFAVALGGEELSWRLLVGGGMILGAMYAVELLAARRPRPREEPPTGAIDAPVRMPGE